MKKLLLLWVLVPLFSSCEVDCPAFDEQIETLSISLFPEDRPRYDFINSGNSLLRFERQDYRFSVEYTETCGGPGSSCDCFTRHEYSYFASNPNINISAEFYILHDLDEPVNTLVQYRISDEDNDMFSGVAFEFSANNMDIREQINNLITPQLTVMNTVFTDALQIDLNEVNMTFIVERNRGLQGIVYQDELFQLID